MLLIQSASIVLIPWIIYPWDSVQARTRLACDEA